LRGEWAAAFTLLETTEGEIVRLADCRSTSHNRSTGASPLGGGSRNSGSLRSPTWPVAEALYPMLAR
jgi:hypothetical protein